MIAIVARRTLWALVVVFLATTVTFFISEVLPGDPARLMLGPQASTTDVTRLRHELRLDAPIPIRFYGYVTRLIHVGPEASGQADGRDHSSCLPLFRVPSFSSNSARDAGRSLHLDLGKSTYYRRAVWAVLAPRMPRTAALAVTALALELIFGTALGALAAFHRGRAVDHMISGLAAITTTVPTMLIGIALQFFLAYRLNLLPLDGYGRTLSDELRSLVLPASTLAITGSAFYLPLARNQIAEALAEPHAAFARAKGASGLHVLFHHGIRNAIPPIAQALMLDLGAFLSGAVVVEMMFRLPGIGALTLAGLEGRDGPLVVGCTLVSACAIVVCNVLGDIVSALLDPRVRKMLDPR